MKGFDPFGSMKNMLGQFQGFMKNPMQYMIQKNLNLPQNINPMQNPQQAIQHLMNNGQLTQEQYNWAQNMSKQIMSNPQFQQFVGQNQQGQMNQQNPNQHG